MNNDEKDNPFRATKAALRYLKSAPEGPYKELITGLVSRIEDLRETEHALRGELQDLKVESNSHQIKLQVFDNGRFMALSDVEGALDWFDELISGGGRMEP